MLSRALILATVTFLLGCLATAPVEAQNLEAGKPPSAIFASTCSLCHKSSRGLIKSVSPGSLPGFLRQHYTTSTDMASAMSAYVLSNGAANAAVGGGNLTKQGEESRTAPKPSATPSPEQAAKDGTKDGTKGRKPTREASKPDADGLSNGQNPEGSADAPKNDAAKGAKQRAAKGKPPIAQASREPPKDEPKGDTRPDPVPPVTPAGAETAVIPAGPKSVDDLPKGPLTVDIQPAPASSAAVAVVPAGPPAGAPAVPVSQ
jgi:hypothetical protein